MRRLLFQAWPVRLHLALAVALGVAGGLLTVFQARYLSLIVDRVFLSGAALSGVQPWLAGLLVAALLRAATIWGGEVAAGRVAGWVKCGLRARLFAHLEDLGPAYTRGERSGELTNTLVEGVEALDAYFSQYLPQLALAALVPLAVLAFVFPLDLISGLVLLLTAPLIPVFMILIGNLGNALNRRQWSALSWMSAHFLDILLGLTTLKLFGRSGEQIEVIARISDRFRDTTMGVLRVTFLSALVLELLATISTAVVAVEVGLRLLYGHLTFEQAFFVLILAPEFYLPLRTLGLRFHAGMAGVTAARRIFEVLDAGRRPPGAPSPAVAHSGMRSPAPHVAFRNVHYTYEAGERPALDGITLEIRPGERVALVGPSGGGKSTVAQLLLRFAEPTQGQITVDGLALEDQPADAWREQVAWVPQHPYLFSGTVAENIRLARPDALPQEVTRAAQLAHADGFIRDLPHGYDTQIGERGLRLSGGQAQRIALARAFLKDAPFLIFDEATANLDPEHETLVQDAMDRLLAGRTALIIAHRLSTVRRADQILVLAGGRIVEAGDHEALLRHGGLYCRMVRAASAAPGPSGRAQAADGDHPPATGASCVICTPSPGPSHQGGTPDPTGDGSSDAGGAGVREGAARHGRPFAARGASPASIAGGLLSLVAPLWPWIALSAFLGFATIASSIGLMATSAWITATAALHPSIAVLQVAIVGVRFFGIARGGFRYLERIVSHQVTFRMLAQLRVSFYAALEPLAPARLMGYRSGDLLARIVADVDTLQHFYIRALGPPSVAILVALLMRLFMAGFDRRLALALLIYLILAGLCLPLAIRLLGRQVGRDLIALRSGINSLLVDGIHGLPDLLAFGRAQDYLGWVRAAGDRMAAAQGRMAAIGGLHAAAGNLVLNLAVLSLLVMAIPLVQAGRLSGVSLAVLVLAAAASFEAVAPLPLAAQYLETSLAAAARLFEIAAPGGAVAAVTGPALSADSGTEAVRSAPEILVHELRFRYAPGEAPALDGVSFTVPPGGRVAIVGPSGAGKSTLANLLLGFWSYQEGAIYLDGRELRRYPGDALRRQIGVVTQSTHLFNATVSENLLLARPGATDEEIVKAATVAQIHDFIQGLPQGYDTRIGEQGYRLSGGQRQRLAIARTLLKNAPVLILDEATANLDALTERAVIDAIGALMVGRTTLTITHRLAGLEAMDEIIVLQNGRIAERGRHEELLARGGGVYRQMWEYQVQAASVEMELAAERAAAGLDLDARVLRQQMPL